MSEVALYSVDEHDRVAPRPLLRPLLLRRGDGEVDSIDNNVNLIVCNYTNIAKMVYNNMYK